MDYMTVNIASTENPIVYIGVYLYDKFLPGILRSQVKKTVVGRHPVPNEALFHGLPVDCRQG